MALTIYIIFLVKLLKKILVRAKFVPNSMLVMNINNIFAMALVDRQEMVMWPPVKGSMSHMSMNNKNISARVFECCGVVKTLLHCHAS